ncbi:malate dehydrogenase (quinone) [Urechidicola croceus]|uniref:Probable malate:quinone oxidoreductase n=1 Tax=Urechidicola croceus TaxID=1850246 RepID=A0A1D8P4T8_9FLAO|nr:malate dehydrogenase (quinone) [Urechidicola croceus]AOW19585.1 malate:quinone oxidoreductase [Urechidicola croceus]
MQNKPNNITLVGAGIMSATLGVLLKKLMPNCKIDIYERLDKVGAESSDAWNNAGTGHAAYCELNYTPELEDGTIDISKALKIGSSFEVSKQFWAYLKAENHLPQSEAFINDIAHMSFVWGEENIEFLKKRFEALTNCVLFEEMKYSEDLEEIEKWIPLMMHNRIDDEKIAVTRMEIGTDVNFGAITRGMINYLQSCDGVEVHLGYNIDDLTKNKDGTWEIEMTDLATNKEKVVISDFVFIGAGGGSIPLLEKTDLEQGRGYAGFPVSGQWLKCTNPEVIQQHEAKVYGKASTGSPPMSVPHLDTRMMNGKKALLFGPYAGFSTKFLKNGSYFDLPLSLEVHNIWPLLSAGIHNIDLTKYLIKQVVQSDEERFAFLQKYFPDAKMEDWTLEHAGQRVQIIKKDEDEGGVLKFGTEIVTDDDGSLAALLGASPGASTSVSIMLDVLDKCFPEAIASKEWQETLTTMIPSYGKSLVEHPELCRTIRERTTRELKLDD